MIKITNKQEYYTAMAQVENYLQKGLPNLSEEESKHLDELSRGIEAWELIENAMPAKPSFLYILEYIMHNKRLSQTQLADTLEMSKSLLSEILHGRKPPSLNVLLKLHRKFQIDGNILLDSLESGKKSRKKKESA